MKVSLIDAVIVTLGAWHAIDLKTLKLANYTDELIEKLSHDIAADHSASEVVDGA